MRESPQGKFNYYLEMCQVIINLLQLPRYKSEKTLRNKLLQAITAGAGFDLS